MGMKSVNDDGGECRRQWYRTRRATLLRLSGRPPENLCADLLHLTIGCRYVEGLLKNPRVHRYLNKHHATELRRLQSMLTEFERACRPGPKLRSDAGASTELT